jgi:tetratricopeptide (TPR) repeat protein
MRRFVATMAAAVLAAMLAGGWALADPPSRQDKPRPPLGNNPNPVIWGGQQQAKPAAPAPKPPAKSAGDNHNHNDGVYRPHYYGVYYPNGLNGYPYGTYGYDAYRGYGYGYDSYLYGSPYYYSPPPIFLPAEELYGPLAMQRFMGVDHWFRPQPKVNVKVNVTVPPARDNKVAAAGQDKGIAPPAPQKKLPDRGTNPQSNNLAWKFLGYGDALFGQQKYAEANDRYRKASRNAPQLADAWFRQGFAMAAIGRYDLAVGAIKRGLSLDPTWPKSAFDLKDLYGADEMARNAHLDALAKAAEEKPTDGDLLFMVGVYLHFDGQADRARKFFQRAAEIAGDDYVKAFLGK